MCELVRLQRRPCEEGRFSFLIHGRGRAVFRRAQMRSHLLKQTPATLTPLLLGGGLDNPKGSSVGLMLDIDALRGCPDGGFTTTSAFNFLFASLTFLSRARASMGFFLVRVFLGGDIFALFFINYMFLYCPMCPMDRLFVRLENGSYLPASVGRAEVKEGALKSSVFSRKRTHSETCNMLSQKC